MLHVLVLCIKAGNHSNIDDLCSSDRVIHVFHPAINENHQRNYVRGPYDEIGKVLISHGHSWLCQCPINVEYEGQTSCFPYQSLLFQLLLCLEFLRRKLFDHLLFVNLRRAYLLDLLPEALTFFVILNRLLNTWGRRFLRILYVTFFIKVDHLFNFDLLQWYWVVLYSLANWVERENVASLPSCLLFLLDDLCDLFANEDTILALLDQDLVPHFVYIEMLNLRLFLYHLVGWLLDYLSHTLFFLDLLGALFLFALLIF